MSLEWDEYAVKKTRERLDWELREKATREGLAKGMRKGLAEGEAKAKTEMAKNLRAEGLPLDVISRCTGFSVAKIKRLK